MKISSCIEEIRKIFYCDVNVFDLEAMNLKVNNGYGKLVYNMSITLTGI